MGINLKREPNKRLSSNELNVESWKYFKSPRLLPIGSGTVTIGGVKSSTLANTFLMKSVIKVAWQIICDYSRNNNKGAVNVMVCTLCMSKFNLVTPLWSKRCCEYITPSGAIAMNTTTTFCLLTTIVRKKAQHGSLVKLVYNQTMHSTAY